MPRNILCFATGGPNPFNATDMPRDAQLIELRQQGDDTFTVRYGLQLRRNLNYSQAAAELGSCIMHAAACDGLLGQDD